MFDEFEARMRFFEIPWKNQSVHSVRFVQETDEIEDEWEGFNYFEENTFRLSQVF